MTLIKGLDLRTGDIVQIAKRSSKYNGRVGEILGSKVKTGKDGQEKIHYTIRLSDKEGICFTAESLKLVRPADY